MFSDGYDTTSLLNEADVLDVARRSQTAMFFVSGQAGGRRVTRTWSATSGGGLALTTTFADDEDRNPLAFFHRIAAATGGVVQVTQLTNITIRMAGSVIARPQTNLLDAPFIKALDDFRMSYVVSYSLAGVPRPGWHEVTVRVNKPGTSYTVRTRNGYTGG